MRRLIPILMAGLFVCSVASAQERKPGPAQGQRARPNTGVMDPWSATPQPTARLGVQVLEITEELRAHFGAPRTAGVLVSKVQSDTPAARAGVQVGDVIVKVAGVDVETSRQVKDAVRDKKKGESVTLTLVRAKRQFELAARMDSEPEGGLHFEFGTPPGGLHKDWRFEWHWPPTDVEQRLREMERKLQELQKRLAPPSGPQRTRT